MNDMSYLFLLIAAFLVVGLLGIGRNRPAWMAFLCGAAVGFAWWGYVNHVEPFSPLDRAFYLVVYTGLAASTGLLIGYVYSIGRKD